MQSKDCDNDSDDDISCIRINNWVIIDKQLELMNKKRYNEIKNKFNDQQLVNIANNKSNNSSNCNKKDGNNNKNNERHDVIEFDVRKVKRESSEENATKWSLTDASIGSNCSLMRQIDAESGHLNYWSQIMSGHGFTIYSPINQNHTNTNSNTSNTNNKLNFNITNKILANSKSNKFTDDKSNMKSSEEEDMKPDINAQYMRRNNLTYFRPKISTQTSTALTNSILNHHQFSSFNNTHYTDDIDNKSHHDNDDITMKEINQIKDIQQFYEMIDDNGKRMYRCKWKNCNFGVTLSRTHILRHIYIKHMELKCSEPNCGKTFKDPRSFSVHRKKHFRHDSNDSIEMMPKISANNAKNEKNQKNRKMNSQTQSQSQQRYDAMNAKYNSNRSRIGNNKGPDKDLSNSVYAGVFNAKNVKQYRERYVVNGKYLHRCKWKGCNYETHSTHTIVQHIHVKHIGTKELRCSVPGCGKMFKYPTSLALHLKYHLCGFRIDAKKYKFGKGLCSYFNIKKYYKRVQMNEVKQRVNKYSYHCQWPDCSFASSRSPSIQRHVHSQHICPNRVSEKSITEILSSELYSKY